MNDSNETLEQLSDREILINLTNSVVNLTNRLDTLTNNVENLTNRLDNFENSTNAQLEAIREGIVANSIRFDRLEAKILNLNANFTELSKRLRQNDKQTLALE
jgi:hypothetical protein